MLYIFENVALANDAPNPSQLTQLGKVASQSNCQKNHPPSIFFMFLFTPSIKINCMLPQMSLSYIIYECDDQNIHKISLFLSTSISLILVPFLTQLSTPNHTTKQVSLQLHKKGKSKQNALQSLVALSPSLTCNTTQSHRKVRFLGHTHMKEPLTCTPYSNISYL